MPKYTVLSEEGDFLGVVTADDKDEALKEAKALNPAAHTVEERAQVAHDRP